MPATSAQPTAHDQPLVDATRDAADSQRPLAPRTHPWRHTPAPRARPTGFAPARQRILAPNHTSRRRAATQIATDATRKNPAENQRIAEATATSDSHRAASSGHAIADHQHQRDRVPARRAVAAACRPQSWRPPPHRTTRPPRPLHARARSPAISKFSIGVTTRTAGAAPRAASSGASSCPTPGHHRVNRHRHEHAHQHNLQHLIDTRPTVHRAAVRRVPTRAAPAFRSLPPPAQPQPAQHPTARQPSTSTNPASATPCPARNHGSSHGHCDADDTSRASRPPPSRRQRSPAPWRLATRQTHHAQPRKSDSASQIAASHAT